MAKKLPDDSTPQINTVGQVDSAHRTSTVVQGDSAHRTSTVEHSQADDDQDTADIVAPGDLVFYNPTDGGDPAPAFVVAVELWHTPRTRVTLCAMLQSGPMVMPYVVCSPPTMRQLDSWMTKEQAYKYFDYVYNKGEHTPSIEFGRRMDNMPRR